MFGWLLPVVVCRVVLCLVGERVCGRGRECARKGEKEREGHEREIKERNEKEIRER